MDSMKTRFSRTWRGVLGVTMLVGVLGFAGLMGPWNPAAKGAAFDRRVGLPVRTVTVAGTATLNVAPDMAWVTAGVTTRGKTAEEAQAMNNQRVAQMIERLKALGVAAADLRTSGYYVHAVYGEAPKGGTAPVVGYEVRNEVVMAVRDLSQVGTLMDAALKAGANTMHGLRFGLADESAWRAKALAQATRDAQAKAEAIAEALGVPLGPVLRVTEEGAGPVFAARADYAVKALSEAAVPVESGTLQVQATVRVVYQLQREAR